MSTVARSWLPHMHTSHLAHKIALTKFYLVDLAGLKVGVISLLLDNIGLQRISGLKDASTFQGSLHVTFLHAYLGFSK